MTITIKGDKREVYGKNASRQVRRGGRVPAVLYGAKTEPHPLILDKKDIFAILKSETGENTIFQVAFDGEVRDVMIKDFQTDPVSDELLHVDLIQIEMDKTLRVEVPVVLVGEAVGVKTEGGFVDFITRELEVECLPSNIPDQFEVDIGDLHMHQSIKAEEISPPEDVEILTDPSTVIVLIEAPSKEEVVEAAEVEEEEVVEEEEEPEVIGKEKADEEAKEEKE